MAAATAPPRRWPRAPPSYQRFYSSSVCLLVVRGLCILGTGGRKAPTTTRSCGYRRIEATWASVVVPPPLTPQSDTLPRSRLSAAEHRGGSVGDVLPRAKLARGGAGGIATTAAEPLHPRARVDVRRAAHTGEEGHRCAVSVLQHLWPLDVRILPHRAVSKGDPRSVGPNVKVREGDTVARPRVAATRHALAAALVTVVDVGEQVEVAPGVPEDEWILALRPRDRKRPDSRVRPLPSVGSRHIDARGCPTPVSWAGLR
mmetsp:Transcript_30339/g.90987  ORF Transcript_30339/g.90987 Transcript_30339/m.90987 type:complete len:258 (-) Transcript_30339:705-1478(-)